MTSDNTSVSIFRWLLRQKCAFILLTKWIDKHKTIVIILDNYREDAMFAWQLYVEGKPLSLNYARGTWSSHWPVNIVSDYWCARTKSRQVWKLFSGASERSMGHSRNYDMRKLWSEDWVCGDRLNQEAYYNDLRRKTQNTIINKNAVTVQIFLEKIIFNACQQGSVKSRENKLDCRSKEISLLRKYNMKPQLTLSRKILIQSYNIMMSF